MTEYGQVSPADEYNRSLVDKVRPADWENPRPAERYNLVVIGAGTAGLVTAAGAADLGARVALVERHLLGGDCLNVGCVPSKCLIRSARAFVNVREAGRFGVRVPRGVEVDFPAVMERMRQLRSRVSSHDSAERFRELGVDVFFGQGRFTAPDAVEVGGATLPFVKAVIAAGARPIDPTIDGLADVGYLTNETVFSLTDRPGRLAVLGAGPLGCELAQAFQRLGCDVTMIQRSGRILRKEDPDAAALVEDALVRDGVDIRLNTTVERAERADDGKRLHLDTEDEPDRITVDEILVGYGRRPNVDGLGLEAAGVAYDERRGVHVNDRLQTTNKNVFAAGDICMRHKFTHAADAAARIVIQNALFWNRKKLSALTIPWCTYTDPEIAHVGLSEKTASDQGIEVDTFVRELQEVDRAVVDGETNGFVRVHVRKGTDKLVGATVVARHAGEMIGELSLAMVAEAGLGDIAETIHPYPTQAEAIKQAADVYNRTRLTPLVRGLFHRLMKWKR